jgi:hypothetical protein
MAKEIKPQETESVVVIAQNTFDSSALPEGTMRDCFVALTMAIMNEFFMSGDTKMMIFYGMISNLEKMGYSPDEIEKFKVAINKLLATFHKKNSFMG